VFSGVNLGDVYIAAVASALLGPSAAPGFPDILRAGTVPGRRCSEISAKDIMSASCLREQKCEEGASSAQAQNFEAELDAARQVRCEICVFEFYQWFSYDG